MQVDLAGKTAVITGGSLGIGLAATRVSNQMSVAITSTGTACGNSVGAMVEAQSAGTPLLHLTGQIEVEYLDRNVAYIHEAQDQLSMPKSVSKAAFRVLSPQSALVTLQKAVKIALTAPSGPVSVEIPTDIQSALIDWPASLDPLPIPVTVPDRKHLDALAKKLCKAKRPILWLGGGARGAGGAVRKFVDMGFGIVTTTQGRGILGEGHEASLDAFTLQGPVEDFYRTCDAMLVVGSRLRGNETLKYSLQLPQPLYQIDVDPGAENRSYACDHFVCGNAAQTLEGLAERLTGKMNIDKCLLADLGTARDATLHSVFEAVGGGIGQGLQMGIGAALARSGGKTICLVGDGGLQLNIGELATAGQEQADMLILIMNSMGYQVIKNIQDAYYGGRHHYVDNLTPDFSQIRGAVGFPHQQLESLDAIETAIENDLKTPEPHVIEIDMKSVGPFGRAFSGPPERK